MAVLCAQVYERLAIIVTCLQAIKGLERAVVVRPRGGWQLRRATGAWLVNPVIKSSSAVKVSGHTMIKGERCAANNQKNRNQTEPI